MKILFWTFFSPRLCHHYRDFEVRETWRSSVCFHLDTPDPMILVFPVMVQVFNLVNVSVGSQSARLKTKFIWFLPVYLRFSDLLLVSSLCVSTCRTTWTSEVHGRWQGSPGIRWELSGKMACCPHLPERFLCVCTRGPVLSVCSGECAQLCVPGCPIGGSLQMRCFVFVFEWLQQPNASLACHRMNQGGKRPFDLPTSHPHLVLFQKKKHRKHKHKGKQKNKKSEKSSSSESTDSSDSQSDEEGPADLSPQELLKRWAVGDGSFQKPSRGLLESGCSCWKADVRNVNLYIDWAF